MGGVRRGLDVTCVIQLTACVVQLVVDRLRRLLHRHVEQPGVLIFFAPCYGCCIQRHCWPPRGHDDGRLRGRGVGRGRRRLGRRGLGIRAGGIHRPCFVPIRRCRARGASRRRCRSCRRARCLCWPWRHDPDGRPFRGRRSARQRLPTTRRGPGRGRHRHRCGHHSGCRYSRSRGCRRGCRRGRAGRGGPHRAAKRADAGEGAAPRRGDGGCPLGCRARVVAEPRTLRKAAHRPTLAWRPPIAHQLRLGDDLVPQTKQPELHDRAAFLVSGLELAHDGAGKVRAPLARVRVHGQQVVFNGAGSPLEGPELAEKPRNGLEAVVLSKHNFLYIIPVGRRVQTVHPSFAESLAQVRQRRPRMVADNTRIADAHHHVLKPKDAGAADPPVDGAPLREGPCHGEPHTARSHSRLALRRQNAVECREDGLQAAPRSFRHALRRELQVVWLVEEHDHVNRRVPRAVPRAQPGAEPLQGQGLPRLEAVEVGTLIFSDGEVGMHA
mmetsp:Transcript_74337/g.215437  ORF Transcript_74337/g.215437 Transcript_74337/m.215437 type:complete len:496 (+) Transcript_74337:154-1641(+)